MRVSWSFTIVLCISKTVRSSIRKGQLQRHARKPLAGLAARHKCATYRIALHELRFRGSCVSSLRRARSAAVNLFLIDAIGPFFRDLDQRRINWSKIPFTHLVTSGPGRAATWARIRADIDILARRVGALGYTAVTLDDVAHLAQHPWYEPEVREQIEIFRAEFRPIFECLRDRGLAVYVTSDYVTTSAAVDARLRGRSGATVSWYRELVERFLDDFPEVSGVVMRIGESDGHDVVDPLRSRLAARSTRQVRRLLEALLPVFESRRRRLIFRTWTVGAHLVGDLIWHRGRLAQLFNGLDSPALIVSMKHGESDFFRYLPLNRHFFRLPQAKLIEFQARREYEGAGEYPSFIGWECEALARELAGAPNVVGFSVWCQTGGWHAFRRLAFLQPEAVWIEINVAVLVRLMRDRVSVEQAIAAEFGDARAPAMLELLRASDTAVRTILYVEEFARQKLFFRRVRIPPLLHVFWDCIFINDGSRRILRHFVRDPENTVRTAEAALQVFPRMRELAQELGLPVEDVEFMEDTFRLLLLARRYYFADDPRELEAHILFAKAAYKARWPRVRRQRYRIRTSFEPFQVHGRTLRWLLNLVVRRQRGYRTVLDHLITLRVLAWVYRLFRVSRPKALPKYARKTAMGVDALFR